MKSGSSWLRPAIWMGVCFLFAAFMGSVVIPVAEGGLVIHVPPGTYRQITISGGNLRTKTYRDQTGVVRIPVEHGDYLICVEFADGRRAWASYFHYDAGVRRRIDIHVAHNARADRVRFDYAINVIQQRSTHSARLSEATKEHPVVIDSI